MVEGVPVEFKNVDIASNQDELFAAAGKLMTSHYACVIDPELFSVQSAVASPYDGGIPLRHFKRTLESANPNLIWDVGSPIVMGPGNKRNQGLHGDRLKPNCVGISFHFTPPGNSDYMATFASPLAGYAAYDGTPNKYLTDLLRQERTDPNLVDVDSFRRVRITGGGILAFTLVYPGSRAQLHDFTTFSPGRSSFVWVLSSDI